LTSAASAGARSGCRTRLPVPAVTLTGPSAGAEEGAAGAAGSTGSAGKAAGGAGAGAGTLPEGDDEAPGIHSGGQASGTVLHPESPAKVPTSRAMKAITRYIFMRPEQTFCAASRGRGGV
jgi:hypothetical protein